MRGLLASPLGFVVGLSLGALGGGGSVLAVPVLVYAAGQTPSQATTTSLIIVIAASIIGAAGHWRAGRVRLGPGLLFGLAGSGGAIAGSALNASIPSQLLLGAFSILILVAAWRMVTVCPGCTNAGDDAAIQAQLEAALADPDATPAPTAGLVVGHTVRLDTMLVVKVLLAGTVVGFVTGLFGVGGGFIVVPALTLVLGYPMDIAIGTSLVVIATNSVVALGWRLGDGNVDWATTIPFAVTAIAGVITGIRVAEKYPTRGLVRGFAVLLVVAAFLTAAKAIWGL